MKRTKKDRRESLGGSDAGAVVGLNKYRSRFDAWWAKMYGDSFEENKWVYWGKMNEGAVARHYAARHLCEYWGGMDGWRDKDGEEAKRVRDDIPWMTGTPDRLILFDDKREDHHEVGHYDDPVSSERLLRRGLEIKTTEEKNATQWHRLGAVCIGDKAPYIVHDFENAKEAVPLSYWFQCQWYSKLMGFEEWDLCVLIGSCNYREYRILYDHEFMERAIEQCRRFWEVNVLGGMPPAIDWGDTAKAYFASHFKEHNEIVRPGNELETNMMEQLKRVREQFDSIKTETQELSAQFARDEGRLRALRKEKNEAWKRVAEIENWFRERIGTDLGVETMFGKVTWKSDKNEVRMLRKKWNKQ